MPCNSPPSLFPLICHKTNHAFREGVEEQEMPIHPAAIVDPKAEIDPTAEIDPYAIIEGPSKIGAHTHVMSHAVVCRGTEIGADCRIHYGAIIGAEPQHLGYEGQERWTRIGNRNVIREYATIHRGFEEDTGGVTRIGDDCLLMAMCHVAHDCAIGNHVILTNNVLLGGHCLIEDHVIFGGASGAHQFVRIGTRAMIGGMGQARRDVPPYMMLSGNAEIRGLNVIGLKRSGMSLEARKAIKAAYRTLFREGLTVEEGLETISRTEMPPEVEHLVEFIRGTERGICRPRNEGRGESAPQPGNRNL